MTAPGPGSFSLRRRLLALLLGSALAVWLVVAALSYGDSHDEVDELFDAQLAQVAQTLLTLAAIEQGDMAADFPAMAHKYQQKLLFQVWDREGRLLLRSAGAPLVPLTREAGFSERQGPEGHWRYFSQWDAGQTLQVQVAEDHAIRDELVGNISKRLMLPMFAGLPLLAVAVWFAIGRGLRPLRGLARQIASRQPNRLTPVAPGAAPSEIAPMVEELNQLMGRINQAIEQERRFTADAAHELRTPLAVLKAQLHLAETAATPAEARQALARLRTGVDRMTRSIEQLLTLARLDPDQTLPPGSTVRLDDLAQEVCADLAPLAIARGQSLELEAETPASTQGSPDLLRLLLRNLVDNAIRYTPSGGSIQVAVNCTDDQPWLTVTDSGPGIPPAERKRVFDRFVRLAGQEPAGSGLGLSIARRIADLHGATLLLEDGPGGRGLKARLCFGGRH